MGSTAAAMLTAMFAAQLIPSSKVQEQRSFGGGVE
jgi:hypothetical protein